MEHHERWDGNGYLRKRGEEICLEGRIVAVADVFDALVSKRSYKAAWSPEDARTEILAQQGRQFDPTVVVVFREHFSEFLQVAEQYKD